MLTNIINDSNAKLLNPSNNFDPIALAMLPSTDDEGISTGSDSIQNSPEYSDFRNRNFIGEGITDKRVWVMSTTYPIYKKTEISVTKCIVLMRNPLKIIEKWIENDGDDEGLQNYCENVKNFVEFWCNCSKQIPVYFVRLENLVLDPASTLREVFSFFLNCENLKETVVESKILTFTKFNKNLNNFIDNFDSRMPILMLENFQDNQRNFVLNYLKDELSLFGYIDEDILKQTWMERRTFNSNDFANVLCFTNLENCIWLSKYNEESMRRAVRDFVDELDGRVDGKNKAYFRLI